MLVRNKQGGFTFIEVVIAATIFLLFAVGAYQAYAAVYASLASTHHKALAADLANAEFEIVKNMPYASVGTVGGNPDGVLEAEETIVEDKVTFDVTRTIEYIDDPFDGVSGGGDALPNDYKLVEIKIDCPGCKSFTPLRVTGWVAPKNLEQ